MSKLKLVTWWAEELELVYTLDAVSSFLSAYGKLDDMVATNFAAWLQGEYAL